MSEADLDYLPTTVQGRATRDRILNATAELMVTDGMGAVNDRSVREAASVSGSQTAYYFPDKSALIRAVIQRQTEVLLDFHRQPALGGLDTFADFQQWVELTLKFSRRKVRGQPLPTYGAIAGQLSKYDEEARQLLADGYRQWVALMRRGLTRMKRNGLLVESTNTAALANVLVSAHQGGTLVTGAYQMTWPDHDALTFALAYLRQFAVSKDDTQSSSVEMGVRRRGAGGIARSSNRIRRAVNVFADRD